MIFRAIVSGKTEKSVYLDERINLPWQFVTLTEDVWQTGDAYKEKPLDKVPCCGESVFEQWEHQRRTCAFIKANGGGLEYLGMGVGKTKNTWDLFQNDPDIKYAIIICPKNLPATWRSEFRKHVVNQDKFHLVTNMKSNWSVAKRLEFLKQQLDYAERTGKIFICCVNYEAIWRDGMSEWILSVPWSYIVCDESQKMKSNDKKARASTFLHSLADKYFDTSHRILLSGTPMPHSPMDIWSQYRFLNHRVFGKSFWSFQNRYCIMKRLGNKEIICKNGRKKYLEVVDTYVRGDEMRKLIMQHAIRYDRDVIDLPESTHSVISIDMPVAVRNAYNNLKKNLCIQFKQGELTIKNALTKSLRLLQLTGGNLPDDDGVSHLIPSGKAEALAEVLEGIDRNEPIVIFAEFHTDLDVCIAAVLDSGRTVSELSGRKHEFENVWKVGLSDVLVVQIASGAVGLDFTRAAYNIFYSTGYNAGNFEQAICRSDRPGQTRNVSFIHLHCADTVDEIVYAAIAAKKSVVEELMTYIQKGA